jgi:phage baseplate assembly protein gpV
MNGFEFGVWDDAVVFRKRATAAAAVTLRWQHELYSFTPRASAVGQVSEVTVRSNDPKTKRMTEGQATSARPPGTAAIWGERAKAIASVGGGSAVVADRVAPPAEAGSMADGALRRNASTFLEAEGLALGSPKIAAGATVSIQGVGPYSGDHVLGATTHIFKGADSYKTRFEITGDRSRAFADLVGGGGAQPSGGGGGGDTSSWSSSLVIGTVTNTNDPMQMGRIKVKFEALGSNIESDWARVATPHAGGKERGMFFLPQVGDEVVVGFEHGDARRPFVLGSLFTGKDKPGPEIIEPGVREPMFGVATPHQFAAHSKKELKLTSDEKMTITVKGNPGTYDLTADGDMTTTGKKSMKTKASQSMELEAGSSVKIKGSGTVEIESSGQLKVKGSTVSVEGSGMVEIKGGMIKLG